MYARQIIFNKAFQQMKCVKRSYSYPTPYMHFLKNLPSSKLTTLCNGLKVATEERHSASVCITLAIRGGTRYEMKTEHGISHLMEHLIFKGTAKRSSNEIQEFIASTGAEYHCCVDREMVTLTIECLVEDACDVIYLLTECAFHLNPSSEEIDYQREIIYEEMKNNDWDTERVVMDYLHSAAFQGSPLEQNIIGTSANLSKFDVSIMDKYLKRTWIPRQAVLATVGGVRHADVVAAAENSTADVIGHKMTEIDSYRYTGSEIRFRDDSLPSAHVAIAVEGPCFCDSDNLIMEVARAYLGGYHKCQGITKHHINVLAQAAGEFCEAYKAFNINYMDSGLWGVHFLAEPLKQEDMLFCIQDQWMRLCTSVTKGDIDRAKHELKAELLYKWETNRGACNDLSRWILYNGFSPQIGDLIYDIDKITAEDVRKVCMRYIYDKCPTVAGVGPTEGLPEYNRIRAGMYWLRF